MITPLQPAIEWFQKREATLSPPPAGTAHYQWPQLAALALLSACAMSLPAPCLAQVQLPKSATPVQQTPATNAQNTVPTTKVNAPMQAKLTAGMVKITAKAGLRGRAMGSIYSPMQLDTTQAKSPQNIEGSSRLTWKADVNMQFNSWQTLRLSYHFAGDLMTGTFYGSPDETIVGARLPATGFANHRCTASRSACDGVA